ncbi:hypothetical protein ACGFU4_23885 [Streptomyces sp. NPDC048511]|uniref:hypothetical protein n=1 Tax=Streptomyces sp. NPDC048511 TaxID=3365562 RepID=UPI003710D997
MPSAPAGLAALVVTGEPTAAYEDASPLPPSAAELALLRAALEAEVPVCLGARLPAPSPVSGAGCADMNGIGRCEAASVDHLAHALHKALKDISAQWEL